jgi:peroxiredoxin
LHSFDAY